MSRKLRTAPLLAAVYLLGLLAACVPAATRPAEPDAPAVPTSRAISAPISAILKPPVLKLSAGSDVPAGRVQAVLGVITAQQATVLAVEQADLLLSAQAGDDSRLACEQILVPVDRFATLLDTISLAELGGVWQGSAKSANFTTIYAAQEVMSDLVELLGPPGPAVVARAGAAIADALWDDQMGLGIVPFEALTPRLRALRINGQSVVDNRFDAGRWPLAGRAWLSASSSAGKAALDLAGTGLPISNRDSSRLTVLAATGVTALARGTAAAIERAGDGAWPARLVGPELAAADLTSTSNEVSFLEGCKADNRSGVMHFCAAPEYMASLEISGVDLVGLTGNHLNDFGTRAFTQTLELYAEQQIQVYGGGANEQSALAPLFVEHNGNRLAFLGANQFGPQGVWVQDGTVVSAWAGPHSPGSARYERTAMVEAIQRARSQADVVFADVQYTEFNAAGDYQTEPVDGQRADFGALADAGAGVVTGVQAHAPQAIELRAGAVILYGLGNLYFDQTFSWPTRTGLVARHTIYSGKLIHTEILVTVIDSNMQVRWATPAERLLVLKSVFAASDW